MERPSERLSAAGAASGDLLTPAHIERLVLNLHHHHHDDDDVHGGDLGWLNASIASAWGGFLRDWSARLVGDVAARRLAVRRPRALESATLRSFDFDPRPPTFSNARVTRATRRVSDGARVLELRRVLLYTGPRTTALAR